MTEERNDIQVQEENLQQTETTETNSWEYAFENEVWLTPLIDIYENENDYVVVASMPGSSKDKIKVKVEEGYLSLMARTDYVDELKNNTFILKERKPGNFYRKFKLGNTVDVEKIDASYENGMLKVVLAKHENAKPKEIAIK